MSWVLTANRVPHLGQWTCWPTGKGFAGFNTTPHLGQAIFVANIKVDLGGRTEERCHLL
jgi:hypothetical protein